MSEFGGLWRAVIEAREEAARYYAAMKEERAVWVQLYDAICEDSQCSPPFADTSGGATSEAMNDVYAFFGGHPYATLDTDEAPAPSTPSQP